jgi:hypothetical protein
MQKQVGLLIMKDENDILYEYLTKVTQYYDKILVLDGGDDDKGKEICGKFPEIIFYEKDKNVIKGDSNDSIRSFLWEKAKEIINDKQWVAILHPDEFPTTNPLELLEALNEHNGDIVMIMNQHFFLHTLQKDDWDFKPGDLIEPKMKYYMAPGQPEYRFFKFKKNLRYKMVHGLTVPVINSSGPVFVENFTFKQFTYRTLEQAIKRAQTRWSSRWQMNDYLLVLQTNDMFFDTLKYPDEYKTKFPKQYNECWYNQPHAYVAKLD